MNVPDLNTLGMDEIQVANWMPIVVSKPSVWLPKQYHDDKNYTSDYLKKQGIARDFGSPKLKIRVDNINY